MSERQHERQLRANARQRHKMSLLLRNNLFWHTNDVRLITHKITAKFNTGCSKTDIPASRKAPFCYGSLGASKFKAEVKNE